VPLDVLVIVTNGGAADNRDSIVARTVSRSRIGSFARAFASPRSRAASSRSFALAPTSNSNATLRASSASTSLRYAIKL